MERTIWEFKGVNVHPAGRNSSGIRWWAFVPVGHGQMDTLRADTKQSMRQLIRDHEETS